jgi:hypothetical protein
MLAALVRWSIGLIRLCIGSWKQAALVTYTFHDVVLSDGGTLNGWVTVDFAKPIARDSIGDEIDYDFVTTQGNSSIPPGEYRNTFLWPPYYPPGEQGPASINVHIGRAHGLFINIHFRSVANRNDFMAPLYIEGFEDNMSTENFLRSRRDFFSYNVSAAAVPEPKTYATILAGLVLIGATGARTRR